MGNRDFLVAEPASPASGSSAELVALMSEQANYLADIALYLRRQNADVLCSAVVKGTSQLTNALTDTRVHEVTFELGGKPVEIYSLLAFSTYGETVTLSILSMSNALDGIPFVAGDVLTLNVGLHSVWVQANALDGGTCSINGPSDATNGGFFLYGFTIPDYDRLRGSVRS